MRGREPARSSAVGFRGACRLIALLCPPALSAGLAAEAGPRSLAKHGDLFWGLGFRALGHNTRKRNLGGDLGFKG